MVKFPKTIHTSSTTPYLPLQTEEKPDTPPSINRFTVIPGIGYLMELLSEARDFPAKTIYAHC